MYLVSDANQRVVVSGRNFEIAQGERILTEYSHKYSLDGFADLAAQAGFQVRKVWTDERRYFSVQYLVRE